VITEEFEGKGFNAFYIFYSEKQQAPVLPLEPVADQESPVHDKQFTVSGTVKQPGVSPTIVEDAALSWFGELGYTIGHGPHMAPGEPMAGNVFGPPPRISIPSSPNLDWSFPNLSSSSSVLPASAYDLQEAMS